MRTADVAKDFERQLDVTGRAARGVDNKLKPKPSFGKCACNADDLMCHMRCSNEMNKEDSLKMRL